MVGTQVPEGSVLKTAQMRGNCPSGAKGCSSAPVRKLPQKKKKRLPRHQVKARLHPRRRLPKSPGQQKLGKGQKLSARNLNPGRRMAYAQSQETRLKTCYCTFSGAVAKLPLGSSLGSGSAKAPKKPNLGWPNSSGTKAEERKKRLRKVETVTSPLAEKPKELTSVGEIQRKSKPTTAGKRRYQAVSEYQFIYPEKSMFHLTRETVKQQLRTADRHSQKQSKQSRTTPCPSDFNLSRRGYPWNGRNPQCPVSGQLLKNLQGNLTLRGLSSLTCKIDQLALVSETPPAGPPKAPPAPEGQQHPLQARYPPAFEQPYVTADAVPQPCSSPEDVVSLAVPGRRPDALLQDNAAAFSSRAGCARSPEASLVSGKDCYGQGSAATLGGNSPYAAYPEEEDAASDEPGLHTNRSLEIARAESAMALLRTRQLLSSEGFGRETPLDLSFATSRCATSVEEGGFAAQACAGKGDARSQSRDSEPRTQDALRSCSD